MNRFYVYVHKRATDGSVFYVGKGSGKRAWHVSGRNDWWKKTVAKHGFTVEVCQSEMSESSAFLLERWLIAKFRHEKEKISNISDGGDGPSGFGRVVYCSNGMKFDSLPECRDFIISKGFKAASCGNIHVAATTKINAYGMSFSFDDFPSYEKPKNHNSKKVYCSNGETYASSTAAASILKENGHPRASQGCISKCARGECKTAYGFSWSYDGHPAQPDLTPAQMSARTMSKPCENSGGYKFRSIAEAVMWLKEKGRTGASSNNLSRACSGKIKVCYGYEWRYSS